MKFGGSGLIIWGCLSVKDTDHILVIDGRMNTAAYQNILEVNLKIPVENLELFPDWIF